MTQTNEFAFGSHVEAILGDHKRLASQLTVTRHSGG